MAGDVAPEDREPTGKAFDDRREATVPATPEQVWEAIATGPGIDSWFMGRNHVDPGPGGVVSTEFSGYAPHHPVTGWEPMRQLAYGGQRDADGRFIAYEFLIEGRTGSTVLRMAVSGFLPGDDWQDEFDAMTKGGAMYFATLVEYLTHFAGRTATPVAAFGPPVADWEHAWRLLRDALGLDGQPARGDRVRFHPPGLPPIDGAVYFTNEHTLGVRTEDALYRFLQGFRGPMIGAHHLFAAVDPAVADQAWRTWLGRVFSPPLDH
jgi:uncharacterized protein YndB with AHSA1/START domain